MTFITAIISFLGFLSGKLLSPRFRYYLARIKNIFYSSFLNSSFKNCGKNFHASYPINIIGAQFVMLGDNCSLFSGTRIEVFDRIADQNFTPSLIIGSNVNIINDCHIGCVNQIVIGDNVLIASKVFITDHFHGATDGDSIKLPPAKRPIVSKGPVIIESDVWIGEGVAIMPNVTIGKNSIIGANAVVTRSFPPNSIIGGVPAKLLRTI